jgi:invasion protein IalB
MSLPSASVLLRAAQLAIDDDKPVYLDYFRDSVEKKCCVGVQPDNTKYLVKSDSEYTSTIQNIFKCETCYIVSTENSLYIVSTDIPVKKIVGSS